MKVPTSTPTHGGDLRTCAHPAVSNGVTAPVFPAVQPSGSRPRRPSTPRSASLPGPPLRHRGDLSVHMTLVGHTRIPQRRRRGDDHASHPRRHHLDLPGRGTANRTSAARYLAVAALIGVVPRGIGLRDDGLRRAGRWRRASRVVAGARQGVPVDDLGRGDERSRGCGLHGASQRPHQPAGTTGFPPGVSVLDATQYHDRNDYRQDRC
jgi:hypothetical protein